MTISPRTHGSLFCSPGTTPSLPLVPGIGILSDVARKNGWQRASQAGESRPDGMQRLLSNAVWDENGVRDELRSYVLAHLRDPYAVVAIDETSFPKRGDQEA